MIRIDSLSRIDLMQDNNKQSATLLHFEDITIDALPLIHPYLINSGSISCDYSVGGIYMWIDYFRYQYCILNDTLFIKGVAQDDTSTIAFSLPLGKMQLEDSIKLLSQYCISNDIKLEFSAIPQERINEFEKLNHYSISTLDYWADYIYNASELATLSGKKYNKKRNHVNRFKKDYPEARIEKIDNTNINKVKECYYKICAIKNDSQMAIYERAQVWKVLDILDSLPFESACLIIDDTVIAFTIGEVINKTLYVHIEKTLHSYSGASETINKEFASLMLDKHDITIINREDDAGEEGLKQAKMTYNPILLLKKYNVMF